MNIQDLERATVEFFKAHWVEDRLGPAPLWVSWQPFLHGPAPNHEHGGCYAIFFGANLAYVGLGASRGGGKFREHGISRRLTAHVIRKDRVRDGDWGELCEQWAECTAIHTIGLPRTEYLAAALESYLIRELSPPRNFRV